MYKVCTIPGRPRSRKHHPHPQNSEHPLQPTQTRYIDRTHFCYSSSLLLFFIQLVRNQLRLIVLNEMKSNELTLLFYKQNWNHTNTLVTQCSSKRSQWKRRMISSSPRPLLSFRLPLNLPSTLSTAPL